MNRCFKFLAVWVFTGSLFAAEESQYCVVSLVPEGDKFEQAALRLTEIRKGKLLKVSLTELASLPEKLRPLNPGNVAFVVRPEQLDINLVAQILKLSTRVDDDPFVDFNYGFITGRSVESATKLAEAGFKQEKQKRKPEFAMAGVAGGDYLKKSRSYGYPLPLKGISLQAHWNEVVQSASNGGERDENFIRRMMAGLEGRSMFAMAGHGFPDRIVDGPTWKDVHGRRYDGAVAYNIACYTGVTSNWFEKDWSTGKLAGRQVDPDESFCLQMIDTGLAAYVAYSCPRPAGPEMFADMISLATEGISVGEQRRRHSNAVILTHLGQGFAGPEFEQLKDGQPLVHSQNVDHIVREMSVGNMLLGDPAFIPFEATPNAYPVQTETEIAENVIKADVSVTGQLWFWFSGDQLEQGKFKLTARVPLEDKHVKAVRAEDLPFGADEPVRLNAAVETHRGKRLLHIKALLNRPDQSELAKHATGISGSFVVDVTDDASLGKTALVSKP